jgi:glycerophosphoryl diester phosphodiesterase
MSAMPPRIAPLLGEAITFAHRGARADAPENTLKAFHLALELGSSGLESDVWLSAEGTPVLDHDGQFGRFRKKRSISDIALADLPQHVPTLEELYRATGGDYDLSLDVKTQDAAEPTVAIARQMSDELGRDLSARLWLCHPDLEILSGWRESFPDVRLVHSTRLRSGDQGTERHAASLAKAGIDAVNMHQGEWTGGLVVLFHRFDVAAFGWDAQHVRMLLALMDMGADGVYCDHVGRMITAFNSVYGAQNPP